jgi:hypothetical protein
MARVRYDAPCVSSVPCFGQAFHEANRGHGTHGHNKRCNIFRSWLEVRQNHVTWNPMMQTLESQNLKRRLDVVVSYPISAVKAAFVILAPPIPERQYL